MHAVTDVTGFGLLGHGLEMARASRATLRIAASSVPLFARARRNGGGRYVTGASHRNWDSYGAGVVLPESPAPTLRDLLTDPQTSGGLLVPVRPTPPRCCSRASGRRAIRRRR